MRIQTQFMVTMLLFGVVLVVVSASAIITNQQVEQATQQEAITSRIAQGANELAYLTNDYLVFRESRQVSQWQTRFAYFSSDVDALQVDKPDQLELARNIQATQQRMKEVFDSVVSAVASSGQNQNPALDPSFLQVSWSRMAVQTQGLMSDTSRLSQLLRNQVDQTRQANVIVVLSMMGVFGAFFFVNYLIIRSRLLKSIASLRAGTVVIGSGNLDFIIEEQRNDEIGELSRAFNQMTASLKGVTASKTELEREIVERKRAEEQREMLLAELECRAAELEHRASELSAANEELETFSYSVSHDLRAPLRHIDGFSKALLEESADQLNEQGRQYLQIVRDGSQRMGQLIDDLLKLSRLTRHEMHVEQVDLSEIAESVAKRLKGEQPERRVELSISPGMVAPGDARLLQVAIDNLLANAWKFTSKRENAQIEFGVVESEGRPVFYVRDNGAGFDPRYAGKLFAPFQRLHRDDDFPGTGIGLATVQRIIHRHGGRVWAEGAPDLGATFYFTLEAGKD